MKFDQIDNNLMLCKNHLNLTQSWGTPIDILLAAAMVVMVYAEFEGYIKRLIDDKIDSMDTPMQQQRLTEIRSKAYRGMLSGDLSEFLNQIRHEYKNQFYLKRNENLKAESYYNNIITHRRNIAHKSGEASLYNFTFHEIDLFYQEGHIILDFFRDVLFEN